MLVMLSGNVSLVKPLQPSNAKTSISLTLLGNVSSVKPEQPQYLLLVDYQYYTF